MKACLDAGVNDLGGTLMNESISRAAGASHGQEFTVVDMRELITAAGRVPQQRTTRYGFINQAGAEVHLSGLMQNPGIAAHIGSPH